MSNDEKPTVEMEQVPAWAVALTQKVGAVGAAVGAIDTKVDRLEMNMELQGGQIGVVQGEVRSLFEWKGAVEQRLQTNSQRAQATSSVDLEHEAKIAATIVKTAELETAIHDTKALAVSAVETLQKQSDYMGMGKQGLKWLFSEKGRTALAQGAVAIVAAYETLKHSGVIK